MICFSSTGAGNSLPSVHTSQPYRSLLCICYHKHPHTHTHTPAICVCLLRGLTACLKRGDSGVKFFALRL